QDATLLGDYRPQTLLFSCILPNVQSLSLVWVAMVVGLLNPTADCGHKRPVPAISALVPAVSLELGGNFDKFLPHVYYEMSLPTISPPYESLILLGVLTNFVWNQLRVKRYEFIV